MVLTAAAQEARRRGDRRLGTDHLLLGLLHEEDSRAARALGVSLADARAALDALDLAALTAVGIEIGDLGGGTAASSGRWFPPLTAILDISAQDKQSTPPRLNGPYVRDESEQARELTETLSIFDAAGVDATFVMTFIAPLNPASDDPLYDLDMASYSLVKSFGGRLGPLGAAHPYAPWDRNRLGTRYPGMPWEPKESFRVVADFYRTQMPPAS